MQSAPPEYPDTSSTAPRAQRDRDEAKYTERVHDNMKPEDRFSYTNAEGRGHFMAVRSEARVVSWIYGLGFERLSLASSQRR
jgi:hypothetical protein